MEYKKVKIEKVEANESYHDDTDGKTQYHFFCPACQVEHAFTDEFGFNGDYEKPSLEMTLWINSYRLLPDSDKQVICHMIISEGFIHYLKGSTHPMINKTVEIPEHEIKTNSEGSVLTRQFFKRFLPIINMSKTAYFRESYIKEHKYPDNIPDCLKLIEMIDYKINGRLSHGIKTIYMYYHTDWKRWRVGISNPVGFRDPQISDEDLLKALRKFLVFINEKLYRNYKKLYKGLGF